MQKSLYPLLISFVCINFTISFITPYLSLDTISYTGMNAIFIATIIFATPYIAQASTLQLFSRIAEKYHQEKTLLIISYSVNFLQFIILFFISSQIQNALIILVITFTANLFTIAYFPAIKAFIAHIGGDQKGFALSRLNVIQTIAHGSGSLLGGILYDQIGIHSMFIISILVASIALIMIFFIPSIKITPDKIKTDEITHTHSELEKLHAGIKPIKLNKVRRSSKFTFKIALQYQFWLSVFSTMFFGLYGPYLQSLGIGSWFYGASNVLAAILGALFFTLFGIIMDKYGPDALFWWGWIAYAIVYGVMFFITNQIAIFILWTIPAYSFCIGTEYLAGIQTDQTKAIQNMAKATSSRTFGLVLGIIFGGFLTMFMPMRWVLLVSTIGAIGMGIVAGIISFKTH